jgi:hypothetical protein
MHSIHPNMTSPEHVQCYQSAVFLNNAAVVLLSHDALSLINTIVELPDDSETAMIPSHEIHKFVTLCVCEAEQRLARLAT